jgi:hypothetical protein
MKPEITRRDPGEVDRSAAAGGGARNRGELRGDGRVDRSGRPRDVRRRHAFGGAAGFLLLSTRVDDPTLAMIAMGIASFSNDLVMPGAWATAMEVGGKYSGTF